MFLRVIGSNTLNSKNVAIFCTAELYLVNLRVNFKLLYNNTLAFL